MNRKLDVLCVGLVNVNLMIGPVDEGLFKRDVSLIGEIRSIPGGDATNECVVLEKLGNRAGIAGMIGRDHFGAVITAGLEAQGVCLDYLDIDENAATSACAVLFREDGARNFATFRGANEAYSLERFPMDALDNVRALNVGSMFALKRFDGAPMAELLAAAQARGVITSADMKADTYRIGYEGIRMTMPHLDYFLPSYDEAKYLTGETDVSKMARVFLRDGAKQVAIKLGPDGCYIHDGRADGFVPAFRAEVADTTGAGDNFVAGFLHGALRGLTMRECAVIGNAAGAASVRAIGATTGVKDIGDIHQVLRQTPEGEAIISTLEGVGGNG